MNQKLRALGFIPQYSEITSYLISITFLLLLVVNSELRDIFFPSDFSYNRRAFIFPILLIGIIFSIYNAFKNRIITTTEKHLILFLIVIVNIFMAISAGVYTLEEAQGWLIAFPLLNIFNALFLFALFKSKILNEKAIGNRQVKKKEVILGTISIILILLISQYVFSHYWAITFSICLVYATMIVDLSNKIIIKNLLKLKN
jgi:hypothetical protein